MNAVFPTIKGISNDAAFIIEEAARQKKYARRSRINDDCCLENKLIANDRRCFVNGGRFLCEMEGAHAAVTRGR